ncbi:MAG: ABC transporter ATP-binding protein [Pseudomonadota bacterium]
MPAISISDLVMQFDGFTAVDHVSLDVDEGEFVTLLGPSGCGKTTLLNLISGFLQPTSGRIEIGGKDVVGVPPEARDTAMCFQSYALFPHLSVRENLVFGLRQKGTPSAQRKARLDEVVGQVDLGAHLTKLPNQLSGGQQQRVALGRALAVRPFVILFDEPLSNLDAKLREQVRVEIRKIQRDFGLTAIYVTHDQAEALAMSDRIFIMNAGRLEQSGGPEEIYYAPRTRFVADFVGSANVLDAEVIGEISADRWQVATPIGTLEIQSSAGPKAKRIPISWRPETAQIGAVAGSNNLEGQVTHRSFQGHFTDLMVDLNGLEQRIQTLRSPISEGAQVAFNIDPKDITFLEPDA